MISALKNALDFLFLFIIEFAWEHYFKADIKVSFLNVSAHVIILIEDLHAFTVYFLDGFWSYHLVNRQQNVSAVEQRDFDRFDLDRLLKRDPVSVNQIVFVSHVSARDVVVWSTECWGSRLEVNEEI
jgi:hypothetical protein